MDTHVAKVVAQDSDSRAPLGARDALDDDERFRIAFDDSPVGMVVCAPDGGFVMVNPAFAALLGHDVCALIGRTFGSVTAPSDVSESARLFGELVRGEREGFEVEKHYLRADGTCVPTTLKVSSARGTDGRLRYAIGQIIDLSVRLDVEAELRQARDHADSLLAALLDGMVELDLERRVVGVNDRFCELVGRDRDELLGLTPPFPWWNPDSDRMLQIWSDVDLGHGAAGDALYVRPNGQSVPVSVSIAAVHDVDDRPSGWIALVRDMSEWARAQIALEARAAADALVADSSTRLLIAPAADVDAVVDDALEEIGRLVGADHTALWRADETERRFERAHTWSHPAIGDVIERSAVSSDASEMPWIDERSHDTGHEALFLASLDDLPPHAVAERAALTELGIQSLISISIEDDDTLLGVITAVWVRDPAGPTVSATFPALRVLGSSLLAALDRAEAENALRRRRDAEALVAEVARELVAAAPAEVDDLITRGLERTARFVGAEAASLVRVYSDDERPLRTHVWDADAERAQRKRRTMPYDDDASRWVRAGLRDSDAFVARVPDDFPDEVRALERRMADAGVRAIGYLPLRSGGRFLGWVTVIWYSGDPEAGSEVTLPALGVLGEVYLLALDRAHAAESLRNSEARFRALVLESGELIQLLDAEGTVLYASPAVERDLGWDVVGTAATDPRRIDVIHAADRDVLVQGFVESLSKPHEPIRVSFRVKDREGNWRDREAMLTNLLDDARVGAIVFNARDVTERRALEEQLRESQKMEAVGQLAGGIAHDFNNLLTAITGYTALLIDDVPAGEPMHADLRQIQTAANRAASLVEQLLQFSRSKPTNPTLLDVNGVIESLGGLFERVIGEHIQLLTALSPDVGLVRADRSQIEQVVMNFVVNARDAMPAGGRLTIGTTRVQLAGAEAERLGVEPGAYFRLGVSDTGTGMDEEVAAHVFEPFFTTKSVGKGTGLGLSTVYGIVTQSHGHVGVTSSIGGGTTFTVYLPVAIDSHDAPTVLLLDAEDAVRVLTREVLERHGYQVVEARNPDAALEAAADLPSLDLLIAEVVDPGTEGPDLASELRSTFPHLRVLYVSGYADVDIVPGLGSAATAPALAKPFDPDQLLRSVRATLGASPRP